MVKLLRPRIPMQKNVSNMVRMKLMLMREPRTMGRISRMRLPQLALVSALMKPRRLLKSLTGKETRISGRLS